MVGTDKESNNVEGVVLHINEKAKKNIFKVSFISTIVFNSGIFNNKMTD